MAALHTVLLARLDRVMVTQSDVQKPEALMLDAALLQVMEVAEAEKLEVYNVSSGARFSLPVFAVAADSGDAIVHGAAAHLAKPGDLLTLAAWGLLKPKARKKHLPRLVTLGPENRLPSAR